MAMDSQSTKNLTSHCRYAACTKLFCKWLTAYLLRQVIRPRVRSYGDISTVTLSPGRILMKFILSFPEICAKMVCPFPMSTWNVVLGRASTTTPSTSIISDFAKRYPSWSGWTSSRNAARVLRSSLFVNFSLPVIFSESRVFSADTNSTCLRFFRFVLFFFRILKV